VVLAVRATDKGETAAAAMPGETEVRRWTSRALPRCANSAADGTADIACSYNNAGVMAPLALRTADGFELQFGTNHSAISR